MTVSKGSAPYAELKRRTRWIRLENNALPLFRRFLAYGRSVEGQKKGTVTGAFLCA